MNIFAKASSLIALLFLVAQVAPADARGFRRSGPNGTVAGSGGSFSGPNGGTFRGGAAGFANANNAFGAAAFRGTGPRGATGQGAAAGGWRRGVGAFERSGMSLKGPGGSSYNGYTKGFYNAKTGQGAYNASHQVADAKNGKTYGDTNQTTYNNGQGVTQLNTDNHGDYTVDWGKGMKPTVQKDPSQ
jgi:hypothetical protein